MSDTIVCNKMSLIFAAEKMSKSCNQCKAQIKKYIKRHREYEKPSLRYVKYEFKQDYGTPLSCKCEPK